MVARNLFHSLFSHSSLRLRATAKSHFQIARTLTNIPESGTIKEIAKIYRGKATTVLTTYNHLQPKLLSILANNDPEALKYAESTRRSCESIGIHFETLRVSTPSSDSSEVETAIINANADPSVHAVQVYYPVGTPAYDKYLQNLVAPHKDVEGLCDYHRRNMFNNLRWMDAPRNTKKAILPCTPLAVIKILEHLGVYNANSQSVDRLRGRVVTVINRSEIVGRPLAALLANDGATVYSMDIDGVQLYSKSMDSSLQKYTAEQLKHRNLQDVVPLSDVVITGVSNPEFRLPTNLLKSGVVAINFSNFQSFESDVRDKASIYIPSIGPVTVSMLQRNVVRLVRQSSPSLLASTQDASSTRDIETQVHFPTELFTDMKKSTRAQV